jgi:hypothetical protein
MATIIETTLAAALKSAAAVLTAKAPSRKPRSAQVREAIEAAIEAAASPKVTAIAILREIAKLPDEGGVLPASQRDAVLLAFDGKGVGLQTDSEREAAKGAVYGIAPLVRKLRLGAIKASLTKRNVGISELAAEVLAGARDDIAARKRLLEQAADMLMAAGEDELAAEALTRAKAVEPNH